MNLRPLAGRVRFSKLNTEIFRKLQLDIRVEVITTYSMRQKYFAGKMA
jgi:hypothetical protein